MDNFKSKNIVDKYGDMIYHIALRRLKNEEDANNIVKEVFFRYIKYIKSNKKFKDEKHEKCWFISTAKNLCYNRQNRFYKISISKEIERFVQVVDFKSRNIVDKYGDMIYYIALKRLKNEEDANDIVQEVFFKYIERIKSNKKFRDENHEKYWLICVCKNLCYNEKNSAYRNNISLEEVELVSKENFDEINSEILENVEKLKDKYRIVVELFYFNGFKISEISDMLQIKEDNVKQRLSRGRIKLRENWDVGGTEYSGKV